jgi:RNA polymerase sigma-32 factor
VPKTKSEPRKPKRPAEPGGERTQQPAADALGHGGAPAAKPKAAPAAKPARAAKPASAKKTAARAGAATKAAAAERAQRDDEDDERAAGDGRDGHDRDGHDDHDEDREEREGELAGDGEVVDVVGEVVDEPVLDEEELASTERDTDFSPPASVSGEAALSRTDPLQAYLREVQRHPLLTPDEERELTQRYEKTQDVRTAARLVTSNLRLVVKLAYEYRRAYKNIMDLIQEGNIGLMQAVKRYDPYRGVKLSSYAAWWIRAYILRFILNNWRLVKLGTTQAQRKLFFNLNKEKAKLAAMGVEPTAAEIAQRLHVEEKEVVEMDRRLSSGEASLDAPVGDTDGRAVSRLEMMPSMNTGPDMALEAREMGEIVSDRLSRFRETLKGKDVIIFDKRMRAEDPLTLQELGDEFGISRERVRQLEARLTMKLRAYLKDQLGDAVGAG